MEATDATMIVGVAATVEVATMGGADMEERADIAGDEAGAIAAGPRADHAVEVTTAHVAVRWTTGVVALVGEAAPGAQDGATDHTTGALNSIPQENRVMT